jgi:pimeloyl-ACP methyl ester carboxylesterase
MECKLDRATIYYEAHGEGIPLVTIHGYPLDYRVWKGCLEPIFWKSDQRAPRLPNIQRIYFDLPGMGRTKLHSELTSSDDIFSITSEFIDTILPDTPFMLAGLSYGGYIARGLVNRMQNRILGLLLVCPLIYPDMSIRTRPPRTIVYRDPTIETSLTETEQEEFDYGASTQTELGWIRYDAEILSGVRVCQLELLEHIQQTAYGLSFDVDDLRRPFDGPSLFLLGKQDSVVGFEDALTLRGQYPRAEIIVVDGAGHSLQIENPDLFNEKVQEWLTAVGTDQGSGAKE